MLVYRMCRSCSKVPLKIVHSVIQAAALIFAAVGLAAAFDYHSRKDIPDMYSLHSWLGLITVILFGLQVVLWPPYAIGQTIIFLPCGFFLAFSSFFPRLISAVVEWMSIILLHICLLYTSPSPRDS